MQTQIIFFYKSSPFCKDKSEVGVFSQYNSADFSQASQSAVLIGVKIP